MGVAILFFHGYSRMAGPQLESGSAGEMISSKQEHQPAAQEDT